MQQKTEKRNEKRKSRKGSSTFVSPKNRKNNKDGRIKPKRLRDGRQFPKRITSELFIRTNNLIDLPFIIESEDINRDVLEVIKDIYPIIKDDISIFTTPKLTAETPPIEFLKWMMVCYTDIYDEWEITYDIDKYIITRFLDYDIDPVGYSLELKFIENIEDERLYNLLIIAFSLMKKACIPFWDNCEAVDMAEEMIDTELDELLIENKPERDEESIAHLQNGQLELKAMEVLIAELNASKVTFDEFTIAKNNFIKEVKVGKSLVDFFNALEIILKRDERVFDYVFNHEYETEEGHPIMPFEYAQIAYSLDNSSAVGYHLNEHTTMNYNEYGVIPFRLQVVNEVESDFNDYPFEYIKLLNLALKVEQEYS